MFCYYLAIHGLRDRRDPHLLARSRVLQYKVFLCNKFSVAELSI